MADHLRLSRAEAKQLDLLRDGIGDMRGAGELGYRYGVATGRDILLLRAALFETPLDPQAMVDLEKGAKAQFPVTAKDLMPAYQGAALGAKLSELETKWIASGFALTRRDLCGDDTAPGDG